MHKKFNKIIVLLMVAIFVFAACTPETASTPQELAEAPKPKAMWCVCLQFLGRKPIH